LDEGSNVRGTLSFLKKSRSSNNSFQRYRIFVVITTESGIKGRGPVAIA
jgi:hypothetical protein